MSAPAIARRESVTGLALPLAAVFVVAMGYGVVLPVLPFMLANSLGEAARVSVAWHTGLLTGVYMLALFLFAPLWGYVSDRTGRRTVILLGLAGFSGAMLWFALVRDLVFAYGARALAGVFAAAVLPVVLAWVSDACTAHTRAAAFAWLSAVSALGFLFGPALSGWLASVEIIAQDDALMLPFYAAAALGAGTWLAVYRFLPESAPPHTRDGEPERSAPSLIWLLALSLLVMFGLGSFEVGLALQGQQVLNLGPREIGWMFAECSLVMILVQIFVLAPLIKRVGSGLLAPAFLAMAAGVALLPYAANYFLLLVGVGLVAAASGILIPALAYLVSLAAGAAQGAALGKQTAAASLGQAAGSAAVGWLFAVLIGYSFWATAALLAFGAVASLRVSKALKEEVSDD
ncbi:MAG: MFS transporter [Gammaproteobacteria bacterium]|nr:MFS transporter [Gammaproteobacteria bacterium]